MEKIIRLESRPVFFDASAMIKLILKEPGSRKAGLVRKWAPYVDTTWVCIAEVLGCLKRKWRRRELSDDQYSRHVYVFLSNIRHGDIVAVDVGADPDGSRGRGALLVPDIDLPLKMKELNHKLDAADAIQLLILREHWGHRALVPEQRLCFVSADEELLKAAIDDGIQTISVMSDDPHPEYDTCTRVP